MAKVTNAFETRDAKGNREDLENAIYNIDPSDTPFMTLAGRRTVKNTSFDWQTEALPTADDTNAQEEGFTLTRTAGQATVRQKSVVQISKRDATVTGSQEAADAAGKGAGEMAHQMALKSKVLKMDMEKIALGFQPMDDGLDDGVRRTRAFAHWLTTNVSRGATGSHPGTATGAIVAGTQRALTETMVRNQMQQAWENGAKPSILLTNSVNKVTIDGFTGRANSEHAVANDQAVQGISVYRTDFGTLSIRLDRWMPQSAVYYIDPGYVRFAFYRTFRQKPIAPIGDAETRMILAEWGVQVDNEKAHCGTFDLFDTNGEYGR
jgi:hypothetical protein